MFSFAKEDEIFFLKTIRISPRLFYHKVGNYGTFYGMFFINLYGTL